MKIETIKIVKKNDKKSIMKKFYVVITTIFICASATLASSEPSPLFNRARDFYAAGQYDSTIAVIRAHLREHGRDPETFTLVPLVTEAYIRTGDNTQAKRLIDMYRQRFPESPFMPRMSYLEGVAFAREAQPARALISFSAAIRPGLSEELFELTISNVERICGRSLSVEELSSLSRSSELHEAIIEVVRFFELQRLIEAGQSVRARNSAEEFTRRYPRSRYAPRVTELTRSLTAEEREERRQGRSRVQVGLLAPMTGDDADIGKYVMEGVKLAIDNYNARAQSPINFIVYDTRGQSVETALRSRDLLTKDQAQVCIGPVLSNTAVVSAAMFGGRDIVMLTPTASEDGIFSLGDNIFQMNITPGTMSRRLAAYALDNLSIRDFAIIAPNNPLGRAMANSFKEELARRNMEVVHEEYFEDGIHDWTPHLRALRNTLIRRRIESLNADRGINERVTQISRADSIRFADSTMAIGGLFMPLLEHEDVAKLAPQVIFHRMRTQMLGTGAWNHPRALSAGGAHINNAIIAVGVQPDQQSDRWTEFADAYARQYNTQPSSISALGYDAAMLVIRAVEEAGRAGGAGDVERIREALGNIQGYQGVSGIISFSPDGFNTGTAIFRITDGRLLRVE